MKSEFQRIQEFAAMAVRTCAFVDRAAELPMPERIETARDLLLELLVLAPRLPSKKSGDAPSKYPAPSCALGFAEHDIYWKIADPYELADAVAGSLSDDFTDIYRDLAPGLLAYDTGAEGHAAWLWRSTFDATWGRAATGALRALQSLLGPDG